MKIDIVRRARRWMALPLVALAAGLAACSNPVETESHPIGLVVLDAQGSEVARFRVGAGATGQVAVPVGAAVTFRVNAIGEDDETIAIDGAELSLTATVDGGLATATVQSENQLVVTGGAQAGAGELRLTLLHGGHEEFFAELPLVVGS